MVLLGIYTAAKTRSPQSNALIWVAPYYFMSSVAIELALFISTMSLLVRYLSHGIVCRAHSLFRPFSSESVVGWGTKET